MQNCEAGTRDQDPTKPMAHGICPMRPKSSVSFVLFMPLCPLCLQTYLHGFETRIGSAIALVAFLPSVPPTCLPCLLHPLVPNNLCGFSIFSIPHLFACITTESGSEPACNCMCYFSISGAAPPIYMASDFSLDRFCNEVCALKRNNATK